MGNKMPQKKRMKCATFDTNCECSYWISEHELRVCVCKCGEEKKTRQQKAKVKINRNQVRENKKAKEWNLIK